MPGTSEVPTSLHTAGSGFYLGEGGGRQACTCPQLAGQPAGVIVPRWPAGWSSYPLQQAAQSTCPPLASQAAGRPAKKPGDKPAGRPGIEGFANHPASWSAGHPSGMGVWLTIKRVTKMRSRLQAGQPVRTTGRPAGQPAGRSDGQSPPGQQFGWPVGRSADRPAGGPEPFSSAAFRLGVPISFARIASK